MPFAFTDVCLGMNLLLENDHETALAEQKPAATPRPRRNDGSGPPGPRERQVQTLQVLKSSKWHDKTSERGSCFKTLVVNKLQIAPERLRRRRVRLGAKEKLRVGHREGKSERRASFYPCFSTYTTPGHVEPQSVGVFVFGLVV